jgi:hypothetical protein
MLRIKYVTDVQRNVRSLGCGREESTGIASLYPVWGTHTSALLCISECDRRRISLKPEEVVPHEKTHVRRHSGVKNVLFESRHL